jgi:nitrogen-specific signal transduction histidine kinase
VAAPADASAVAREQVQRFRHFFTPLRHFEDVGALAQGVVDGIANAGVVLRAGIFVCTRDGHAYRFRAGLGCRDEARNLAFSPRDPLVRWLEMKAQLVSRPGLRNVPKLEDRVELERALGRLGAELIVPLHGRQGVLGWIFLGQRATGEPFDPADFRDIMIFAEHVSTALENALLFEEASLQRTFGETLLHTIPTGIVAIDPDGCVRWFNEAAERILELQRTDVLDRAVEVLGLHLADLLRNALRADAAEEAREWTDAVTKRSLAVRTARLNRGAECLGAVAFVHDLTHEVLLNQKQRELERATFWTELAASMSHEVRNPLVAIKTFAQLLPERYNDSEFRTEFSSLMTQEVDRLDGVIGQINRFANLPRPDVQPTDIREVLLKAIQTCRIAMDAGNVRLETSIPPDLPIVMGDQRALVEGFAHLISNAVEALFGRTDLRVTVVARQTTGVGDKPGVEVTVRDNGGGIPPDMREKVFSPFCTTKAGGMGLGLPIVQRMVTDHNGQIRIDSSGKGTAVTVTLPATSAARETTSEAPVDSRRRAGKP